MTCRECFHWEACKAMAEAQGISVLDDFDGSAERCDTFIDAAGVVPTSEVERLKKRLEYTDIKYLAAVCDMAQEYKRFADNTNHECLEEIDRLKKALETQDAEYTQALHDKAREYNMAIDKICLERREEIRRLQALHKEDLANVTRDLAIEIFWKVDNLLTAIYLDDEDGTNFVGVDIQKYHALKKKYMEN